MNDVEESCGNCRFYKETAHGVGICRRNPASVVIDSAIIHENNSIDFDFRSEQPRMLSEEWCGEWHPKDWVQFEKELRSKLIDASK